MADIDDLIRQVSRSERDRLEPRVCEAMMLTYFDFIFRLSYSLLGDSAEADDAAQETFLKASLHISQYQAGTNMKSWLARIAVNVCKGRYRRQKARQRLENVLKIVTLQMHAATPTPEDDLIHSERQQMVKRAVDGLDEKHRLPVVLRYEYGLSVPEIAQILEEPEGTIHSRLHYAHRKLRDRLEGLAEVDSTQQAGVS